MRPSIALGLFLGLLIGSGCTDRAALERESRFQAQQLELERQRLAIEQSRLEMERQAAEEARRREAERREVERLEGLAVRFARAAANQLMDAIGGGQDLIVRTGEWTFDRSTSRLDIPIEVSFNGAFFRSNQYSIAGVLSVNDDGREPLFARAAANQMYRDAEIRIGTLLFTAAGIAALNDMTSQSTAGP